MAPHLPRAWPLINNMLTIKFLAMLQLFTDKSHHFELYSYKVMLLALIFFVCFFFVNNKVE